MSPVSGSRRSGEGRLSVEERTHRAEILARARGESITSTSGAAPIAIRIPSRDERVQSEVVGSPVSIGTDDSGRRQRSASVSLGLVRRSRERTSGDRSRSATHRLPPLASDEAGSTRARSRTVAGAAPRNRSDSVGLISFFGLGSNGVEAKMQSWEDTKRDLMEKGGREEKSAGGDGRVLETTEEDAEEDVHHDDEVVEHLDVIGTSPYGVSECTLILSLRRSRDLRRLASAKLCQLGHDSLLSRAV